ncbi:Dynamin family protein [Metarhizium album ARSEF 1941]|uniref:Dynamin family protein n=1 Tax=Metarhizium album (strain ARSEF 1941) TaxID=1081103 RepID=A0A0B2WPF2_METAS|nr:Dynamin family protein [Metarhizium album ARSEF 1941]KHN95893.1 Dynamin family protein [Metarhizium album ARSEF 1941]
MRTPALRRQRGGTGAEPIKPDPDASIHGQEVTTVVTSYDGAPTLSPVDRPSRQGRSNAPAPSERSIESGPLFREIRTRPIVNRMSLESPTSNHDDSFFHTSFQDIGKKLKACNDTLGELQQLGVSHDVQLPELVLVGDQSAGKSSLMSGLANLDLPRSEGTCTRCPLHIRVSRNSDWSCRVWLRKEYSFQPPTDRPIAESDVTDEDPFFPWRKQPVSAVHEFKTMQDKSQIEEVLRWAQIAILNDDKHHALFIPGSGGIAVNAPIEDAAAGTVAKFSPNVVALEIKGPDLPDLSFYDMPGIFQNPADAKDDYLVSVVRNLSKAYIQHPSAIIICSMPMNSDAENSSTFGLTRRLGATSRTIGVLTKADLLPEAGNHDQWLAIMKGCTHHTGLGYFITSRPQGKDLDELKKWEEVVFESHSVGNWPSEFHEFSERCGVEKLKSFLSERLGEEFAKSLPNIKHKVKHHLDKITKQLANLPELPHNVELEIQTGLMTFADSARLELDRFNKHFSALPCNFRDCLLEIKPRFTLKDKSDFPVLEISDDESDAASFTATTPTAKRHAAPATTTPSKRPRLDSALHGTSFNGRIKPEEQQIGLPVRGTMPPRATPAKKPFLAEPFAEFTHIGRGFRTLRQVRDEIDAKTKAGMPDHIPAEVYRDLVAEAVRPWNKPMDAFIKQTMRELQSVLECALNKALEGLKKRFIYPEAKRHLRNFLEEHRKETEHHLVLRYSEEKECLLTFNDAAFKKFREDEHVELVRFRHFQRLKAVGPDPGTYIPGDKLPEDKRAQDAKKRDQEMLRLGKDPFERELEVIAYVRGYYRLAALRFTDAVSQRIMCSMIPAIRRQLPYCLQGKLGIRGPDAASVYERLMEEDETTAGRRETLKSEKDKFVRALASIELLENGAAAAGPSKSMSSMASGSQTETSAQMVEPLELDSRTEEDEV